MSSLTKFNYLLRDIRVFSVCLPSNIIVDKSTYSSFAARNCPFKTAKIIKQCDLYAPNTNSMLLRSQIHLSGRYFTQNVGDLKVGNKNEMEKPPEKLTLFQRFKSMYRDYWYVLVPVHVVTSAFWFGSFYYAAKSGIDLGDLVEKLHISESIVEKIRKSSHSTTGYLAIAYALYKIATPLRYTVTLGGTTISINYLKKWGYIKPIMKRDELRKLITDKRRTLREKRLAIKDNMIEKLNQKKS